MNVSNFVVVEMSSVQNIVLTLYPNKKVKQKHWLFFFQWRNFPSNLCAFFFKHWHFHKSYRSSVDYKPPRIWKWHYCQAIVMVKKWWKKTLCAWIICVSMYPSPFRLKHGAFGVKYRGCGVERRYRCGCCRFRYWFAGRTQCKYFFTITVINKLSMW